MAIIKKGGYKYQGKPINNVRPSQRPTNTSAQSSPPSNDSDLSSLSNQSKSSDSNISFKKLFFL